jgi:hypothetical protein
MFTTTITKSSRCTSQPSGGTPLRAAALVLLLLSNVHAPVFADEAQERFDEAMAALEAERIATARKLLADLVSDYPTLHRARLELARTEYLARDYDAAEESLEAVLADPDVPASVRPTLLAFLAQIRDDRRKFEDQHRWGGYVYGGIMYDSNVNFGTTRDIIDIGGLPFVIDPDARELDDWAGVLEGGVSHTYNPQKTFEAGEKTGYFLWQTQGNAYYRGYFDETDFNFGVLTARTGPAWVVPQDWRASVAVQGDQIWFGSSRLAVFVALNPSYSFSLNPNTEVTFDLFVQERDYNKDEDEGRDGTLYSGLVILSRFLFEGRVAAQVGAGYSDFDADEDFFGYDAPEVFVGATWSAWQRGAVFGRAGYRWYSFDGQEPLFNESRDDDELRLTAGFQHELAGSFLPGWVVRGEWVWTDNDSDIEVFDWDRNQVTLGISRGF